MAVLLNVSYKYLLQVIYYTTQGDWRFLMPCRRYFRLTEYHQCSVHAFFSDLSMCTVVYIDVCTRCSGHRLDVHRHKHNSFSAQLVPH